jgi:hypothetical protein
MTATVATVWAMLWLAVAAVLTILSGRIGRPRAASWLMMIGLFLVTIEEPALTLWLATATPRADHDGIATLVTPMARAHVIDAAGMSLTASIALICVAAVGVRRQYRWAWRVQALGFAVVLAAELVTTLAVFSRGLAVPGPAGAAGRDGFGWQPVAVGLLAWALGVWLGRLRSTVASGAGTPAQVHHA